MNANTEPNTAPKVINGRIDGKFAKGYSGNPGGSPEATRRAFNKRFLLDLAEDWQQHGREVFKRVRRESPAAYLKVCAMLVPLQGRTVLRSLRDAAGCSSCSAIGWRCGRARAHRRRSMRC